MSVALSTENHKVVNISSFSSFFLVLFPALITPENSN